MSYYATGSGRLKVAEDDQDELIGLVGGFDDGWTIGDDFSPDYVEIEFSEKYRTDEVLGELRQLVPLVQEGSYLQFTGEDNNVWRLMFRNGDIDEITAVFLDGAKT